MRILVVEDDNYIAQAIAATLGKQQHYLVDIAPNGRNGWELATAFHYDLILLDVMLPEVDGISLCEQLRQEGYQMPILIVTAKDTRSDKVKGLDAGADDYIVKPFDFQELFARIRALLRRGSSPLPTVLEWGLLRLDPSSCQVTYDGRVLHVTAKEYAFLELFLRNSQRVFSRSAIVELLWNLEEPPQEDTIKSYIKSLRQKLKAAGAPTDLIETVYGLGYRLKPLSEGQSEHQETEPNLSDMKQQILLALTKFREALKAEIGDRLEVLERATQALSNDSLTPPLRQKAEQQAHKLAGTLGSFGFAEASRIAQEIEDLLGKENYCARTQSLRLARLVRELHRQIAIAPTEFNNTEAMPI
ncbi:MAG: response regulator [Hydrococcus sp. Prado102]|jgi:DNA-binding response OmpR family regulator/HPt (histidine-containing phosphotransfer) domain-containing protein|nr:response regulator [Hydrococcus sp. Prado102]